DFDQLVKVRDERAGLLKQIEKADEQARLAGEQLSETLQQETEARSRLGELRDGQRDAEAAVTAADDAVSYRRRVADAVERQERIRELQSRQNKAEAAEARARDASKKAAAILVTDEVLKRIAAASKTLDTA